MVNEWYIKWMGSGEYGILGACFASGQCSILYTTWDGCHAQALRCGLVAVQSEWRAVGTA